MKKIWNIAASAALIALLAACGGSASGFRVFGDSLADSGTFGLKFTVNAAGSAAGATPTSTPIWPEIIAESYGKKVCNFYNATSFTSFIAPTTTCTNYAVGGGKINSQASSGGPTSPFSIPAQMDAAASVVGGTFPAGEIMLIDGGGNDAADLVGAYLGAVTNPSAYMSFLSSLLPSASVTAMIGGAGGAENLAGMYMTALANKFADDINSKLIGRGADRLVVLNMPAVTNTPRFKLVLQAVAASPAGAAGAAQVEALARAWSVAYNTQLNTRLGSSSKVAIVDFYKEFNDQVSNPASFGITNITTPACPVVGRDAQGLPLYNFAACTAAALDASGPANWRTYAFSDGFHPTPLGQKLLADSVTRALKSKSWL
jgi:outer membrane lipase/esterase